MISDEFIDGVRSGRRNGDILFQQPALLEVHVSKNLYFSGLHLDHVSLLARMCVAAG